MFYIKIEIFLYNKSGIITFHFYQTLNLITFYTSHLQSKYWRLILSFGLFDLIRLAQSDHIKRFLCDFKNLLVTIENCNSRWRHPSGSTRASWATTRPARRRRTRCAKQTSESHPAFAGPDTAVGTREKIVIVSWFFDGFLEMRFIIRKFNVWSDTVWNFWSVRRSKWQGSKLFFSLVELTFE